MSHIDRLSNLPKVTNIPNGEYDTIFAWFKVQDISLLPHFLLCLYTLQIKVSIL